MTVEIEMSCDVMMALMEYFNGDHVKRASMTKSLCSQLELGHYVRVFPSF
jgi:hypothetical protein